MAIKCTTPRQALRKAMEEQARRLALATERSLLRVGERAVAIARTRHTYLDRTGNLTSSLGYILVHDGAEVAAGGFEKTLQGGQGAADGKAFARSLAANYPTGWALILVAGKDYASCVADRGYDVTASAELEAEAMLGRLFPRTRRTK